MSKRRAARQERFILRFRGPDAMPGADRERIRALEGLVIVDDSSPRMLLVEARPDELKSLVGHMSNWILTPEETVPLPDLRPKIRNSAPRKGRRPS